MFYSAVSEVTPLITVVHISLRIAMGLITPIFVVAGMGIMHRCLLAVVLSVHITNLPLLVN